uniref:Domain of unknown function DB domain-containing protein n=1 Tax=Wuchereria bancrofti TaxID=6293 RepID=A0AAF5PX48_WUCBA
MMWYQACIVSLTLLLIASLEVTLAMSCCNRKKDINHWCKMKLCNIQCNFRTDTYSLCTIFGNTMMDIWQCAGAGHNHRKCCTKNGVPPNCQTYCNGKSIKNIGDLSCIYYADPILACFKKYYESNSFLAKLGN